MITPYSRSIPYLHGLLPGWCGADDPSVPYYPPLRRADDPARGAERGRLPRRPNHKPENPKPKEAEKKLRPRRRGQQLISGGKGGVGGVAAVQCRGYPRSRPIDRGQGTFRWKGGKKGERDGGDDGVAIQAE
jgi:hypothetical protein